MSRALAEQLAAVGRRHSRMRWSRDWGDPEPGTVLLAGLAEGFVEVADERGEWVRLSVDEARAARIV